MESVIVGAAHVGWMAPEELEARSRVLVDRKLRRFLDPVAVPALLAADHLVRSVGADPACTGLFTISSWDPDVPPPPFDIDSSEQSRERLSRFWCEDWHPTEWLRRMSNSPLCHTCIALGIRGANAHFVSDATGLAIAVRTVATMIETSPGDVSIMVAYDLISDYPLQDLRSAQSQATAVALAASGNGTPVSELSNALASGEEVGGSAELALRTALRAIPGELNLVAGNKVRESRRRARR